MRLSRSLGVGVLILLPAVRSVPVTAADRYVPAGGDLQAAIDEARPGDTISLEPGATYVGNFRLPVHGGTTHVTIRSGATNSVLPPDGTRISPAHAPHLAKIKSPNTLPAIATDRGAAYWRLLFLELQATDRGYYDIVTLGDGSNAQNSPADVPHHLIVDRVYIHGDRLHGQKRGIALNSGTTTIANCHISGIRAIEQDSQAIAGWNGPGPYTIENNYLEAAGEVFMLGGAAVSIPNLVPSDVVLRGNTLTRPLSWRASVMPAPESVRATSATGGSLGTGRYGYRVVARRPAYDTTATSAASPEVTVTVSAGARVTIRWDPVPDATEYRVYGRTPGTQNRYWTVTSNSFTDDGVSASIAGTPSSAGTVWQVKNLLELKNARRVLIDHNVLEHNWAEAQDGMAVLFTPRAEGGTCPWCSVENVTFEYNVVRGVGAGFSILGVDYYNPSRQAINILIRHNEFSDMGDAWGGSGYFVLLQGQPRNVVIDHNTIISPKGSGVVQVDGPPIQGFVFTNNVARHNSYGIIGTGRAPGLDTIRVFFPGGVIARNVFAGGESPYPADNELPTVPDFEAHFVNYSGGNFALKPGTDWARAGTDGLDLGAVYPGRVAGPSAPAGLRVVR